MYSRISGLIMAAIFLLVFAGHSAASPVVDEFLKALDEKDSAKMSAVIEKYKLYIPATITSLIKEAMDPGATPETKEEKFYVAELIATHYRDQTGETAPLLEVKRAVFNSRLTPAVRSTATGGVHIIDIPEATGEEMNVFRPDNIIIKAGETVRWVNHDKIAHVFASMAVIGAGGIFVPNVDPGDSYDFKFDKPGEYYYICFIHKGMIGKVTVEGSDGDGAREPAKGEEGAAPSPPSSIKMD